MVDDGSLHTDTEASLSRELWCYRNAALSVSLRYTLPPGLAVKLDWSLYPSSYCRVGRPTMPGASLDITTVTETQRKKLLVTYCLSPR